MDGTLDTVDYSDVSPSSVFARDIYVSSNITFCRTISCLSVVLCVLPFVARLLLRLSSIPRPVTIPSVICRGFALQVTDLSFRHIISYVPHSLAAPLCALSRAATRGVCAHRSVYRAPATELLEPPESMIKPPEAS